MKLNPKEMVVNFMKYPNDTIRPVCFNSYLLYATNEMNVRFTRCAAWSSYDVLSRSLAL